MSTRAHVLKKYDVKYGSCGLSWGQDFLIAITNDYIDDSYTGGEYNCDSCIWEFDKDQFKDMVDELDALTEEEWDKKCEEEWGDKDHEYHKEDVVDLFKSWLKETPKKENYVRVAWF